MANLSRPFGPHDKAGILPRVSTEAQADDDKTSLASQEALCRAEMARLGVPVYDVYTEPGASGGNYHSRRVLQQALEDVEAGKFTVFVTASLSRAARDVPYQIDIWQRVCDAGARFYSCDIGEVDPDDPYSFFTAIVYGGVNQLEKAVIRRRMMGGKKDAAKAGRQPCRTHSPFGYHIVQKNDVIRGTYPPDSAGKYIIVEEEAAHVRNVFAWYAGGASLLEVTRRLWNAGARPKKGGDTWHRRTVLDMLTNTVYKGQATYGLTQTRTDDKRHLKGLPITYTKAAPEGTHTVIAVPALVDEATWAACQVRRVENQSRLAGAPLLRQLLTGFTFCANCGRKLHFDNLSNTARASAYRCSANAAVQQNALGGCNLTRYNKALSERLVVQGVAALATSREVIAAAIEMFTETLTRDTEREAAAGRIAALEKQAAELKARQTVAVRAQMAGIAAGVEASIYTDVLTGLQTELRTVAGELETLRRVSLAPSPDIDAGAVASFVARAMASVEAVLMSEAIPTHEKNAALLGIVDRVLLERGEPPPGKKRPVSPGAATVWLKPLFEGGNKGLLCGSFLSVRNPPTTKPAGVHRD